MTTTTRPMAPVALSRLTTSDGPLTGAQVLRLLDRARRDLSRRLTGDEGMGAGYDALRVRSDAIAAVQDEDVVTVTAAVTDVRSRRHRVDYEARATNVASDEGPVSVLLVQAQGWTLTVSGEHVPEDQAEG